MNMNSGYTGYSMSNRAMSAYNNGEKPISKWTKADIISGVLKCATDDGIAIPESLLSKLTKQELANLFLYRSSWHHTSSYINRTDFYSIDSSAITDTIADTIADTISGRAPKSVKTPKATPEKVTALCRYTHWAGTRKHPKATVIEEVLTWTDGDKLIQTENGCKRLSSITILNRF